METNTFLKGVLSDEGYYCVFAFRTNDDRRVQKFYDSIDALIQAAEDFDSQGYDTYFALSTFNEHNSRKVINVKYLKSFFLDLDCGPSKDFTNQREAIDELRSFCGRLSLPKPLMVSSGRGIHAYWPLTEHVCLDDWLPVAEALKKQCAKHGLAADPAVTADAARILRVPSTHNYKDDPPSEVVCLEKGKLTPVNFDVFSEKLGGGIIIPPTKIEPDTTDYGKESVFKDILLKTRSGKGCKQLHHIVTNQHEVTEPLWRAGLSIAKFCIDGEKAAHIISRDHTEYSEEETSNKFDLIKGPYLCTSFDEHNAGVCTECPHWGKIKSPIVLGQRTREATGEDNVVQAPAIDLPDNPTNTYVIPTYPNPYFRGAHGGVYARSRTAEGDLDEKLIYHNDIYVVRRLRDVEVGEAIVMRLHLPKDGVREFTVPLTAVTSREEFRKQMSMQGVAVTRMDDLMQYTTTWVNEMQANSIADEAHRQFGWTSEECKAFVLGNQEIHADRTELNPPSTPTAGLFPSFEPKGSLEEWKKTVNFYNKEGFELHQYVLGTGFGSVLMQLSPINCAGLHLHGGTGVGKTTAMYAGASIWGNPDDLVLHERDTHNTRMNRGEVYHNLPLYMDELTNANGKELSNLAYQLTGGRQRGRMASGSNTERHRGESWRLLAVTTGNASFIEQVSTLKAMPKAEAQRIMECRVKRIQFDTKEETDKFSNALMSNYGHAGVPFVKYVMKNLDGVRALLTKIQSRVDGAAKLTAENRFWSVGVATTITGLMIAKRIGLIEYDVNSVFRWAVGQLNENKRGVDDMGASVEEILNNYINEHWGNVLWIKSTDDLRRQGDKESIIIPELLPRGKLVARYETDLKRAFLVPKPLKVWCGDQQINYSEFVNQLKSKLGAKKAKMRLSKGTHMNLPPTDVIIVDCSVDNENAAGSVEDV